MADTMVAPKWTYDHEHASIRDASGRLLADVYEGNEDCGDIGKLMASAPDLARMLYELSESTVSTFLERAQQARALLAVLPVLPEEKSNGD